MGNATFLLVINASIGLAFAAAFVGISLAHRIGIGFWCAAGFVCAAATVCGEALAPRTDMPALMSALSFSSLLAALALIAAGVQTHYKPAWPLWPLAALFVFFVISHVAVVSDLQRDSVAHAFAYQLPFAVFSGLSAVFILVSRRKSLPDCMLLAVTGVSALQFLGKAALAHRITTGTDVNNYIFSAYAHYSQTLGAILSLLLGVCLLTVIAQEAIVRTRHILQKDHLSGLWNRGAFFERAERALAEGKGRQAATFFILCDLDHFKRINDTFGHDAGDEVIRAFARCIEDAGGELCGRIGGEEFAVLFRDGNVSTARHFVEEVRTALSVLPFSPPGLRPTASYGIAFIGRDEALAHAVKRADVALYEAKLAGRDTYRFATAPTPATDDPAAATTWP